MAFQTVSAARWNWELEIGATAEGAFDSNLRNGVSPLSAHTGAQIWLVQVAEHAARRAPEADIRQDVSKEAIYTGISLFANELSTSAKAGQMSITCS